MLPCGNIPAWLARIAVWLLILMASWSAASAHAQSLRIGITPAIVHDQYSVLEDWRSYLQAKLKRPVEFVIRDSYRDTIEMIKHETLDFAWVSSYPYAYLDHLRYIHLLSTPIYQGHPYYHGYLIVPATDAATRSMLQLEGQVFAYADPFSNTGYLMPRVELLRAGKDPAHFFRKTFFTWSHRKVIEAVAVELANGGYVDSFVWDTLKRTHPDLTAKTRIVATSEKIGFPPIVARLGIDKNDFDAMQRVLFEMAGDPAGAALLKRLNIDGFGPGNPRSYDIVIKMMRSAGDL